MGRAVTIKNRCFGPPSVNSHISKKQFCFVFFFPHHLFCSSVCPRDKSGRGRTYLWVSFTPAPNLQPVSPLPSLDCRCWKRAAPHIWKASWPVSPWGSLLPRARATARSYPRSVPPCPSCRTWKNCPSSQLWRNPRRTTRNAPRPSSRCRSLGRALWCHFVNSHAHGAHFYNALKASLRPAVG